ncbi:hypothetical protein [Acidovorax sp.]|uniref:hypothetical protein n=1 Tax=Acidovorax sp. TaxID=1872122 RepID=UPI00391F4FAC
MITVIVALAMLISLSAVGMYYGGDTFGEGQRQAESAAIINQGQQIAGAIEMYAADTQTNTFSDMTALVPAYLTSLPEGWELTGGSSEVPEGFLAFPIPGTSAQKLSTCEEVNKKLGLSSVPACGAVAANFAGCCTTG